MESPDIKLAKILIVDDESGNVRILNRILRNEGYENVHAITDPRQAKETCGTFEPDLVILDLKMPYLSGFEVMDLLKSENGRLERSVLILSAQMDRETRVKALESGARDYINKPLDRSEALCRIHNMLETQMLHRQVQEQNFALEKRVKMRTQQLEETRLEVIHRLARAAEYRDNETGEHVIRMSMMCARLGKEIGMNEQECQILQDSSPLHDVGKIGIPDNILLKPGKLSEEDWHIMKLHPTIGAQILSGSSSRTMQMAEVIALTHQERWDGSGYPAGLKGKEIPIEGRISAICDVFDALTSERPYKKAFSVEQSVALIKENRGIMFDPELTDAFISILPDMVKIIQEHHDDDEPSPEDLKVYRLAAVQGATAKIN
ncbi:MAG: response regulator [Candidatus Nitrohelix vancouverensis]|uniref:Response regulator n=1 Tax=Candidatus Nitrohelix vancouverensis TaxID=2705534 RepID=A0A7T0G3A7_9BACT|nr:MAG: response regulator [Candidatus Nitrohelix vancouverensis]